MLEIKYRGPLTPQQTKKLIRYFSKKAKRLFSGQEKVLFLDTTIFPSIGDFHTGFSRVSLKRSGNAITVRIKEGNPSAVKREELSFTIAKKEWKPFLYFLNALGLRSGYYRPSFRHIYQLGQIRFSLKTRSAIGDHFEMELPSEEHLASPAVQGLLSEFGLQVWSKEAYQKRIAQGMKAFPAIAVTEAKLTE